MLITNQKLEKALKYLCETDLSCAKAQALAEGLKKGFSVVKAIAFTESKETSAAAKEQGAYRSTEYIKHKNDWENALADYLFIKNKRDTAVLITDIWRSENSSRNKGHV